MRPVNKTSTAANNQEEFTAELYKTAVIQSENVCIKTVAGLKFSHKVHERLKQNKKMLYVHK